MHCRGTRKTHVRRLRVGLLGARRHAGGRSVPLDWERGAGTVPGAVKPTPPLTPSFLLMAASAGCGLQARLLERQAPTQ